MTRSATDFDRGQGRRSIPIDRVSAPGTLRGRDCARMVEQAIRLGYRHIDTAQMYDNEREVGEGVRASGMQRDEVFVTTKVQPTIWRRAISSARPRKAWRSCGSTRSICC